jgi:hypothetical protein
MIFLKEKFKPIITIGNIFFSTTRLEKNNNTLIIFLVNILKCIILFYILIYILLNLIDIYSHYFTIDLFSKVLPSVEKIDSIPMYPVRWWPSGVPQGWTGTALATFGDLSQIPNILPRVKVLGALGSAGITATQFTYQSAVENPVGFNRLMWGFSEFRRTGVWPSLEQIGNKINDNNLNEFITEAIKHADKSKLESIVNEVTGNSFLPSSNFDFSGFISKLIDLIFKETMQILQPVPVQGFFDDLIGQRMFIEIILFILCISIILLIIVFIFNLIFLLNRDKIIKKFDNKFITFYVSYQAFFSWITLFVIPIFIFTGLFTLCHGLHWLITNQIPYESLDIDLHKFISSSQVLGFTLSSNDLKFFNFNNNMKDLMGIVLIIKMNLIKKTKIKIKIIMIKMIIKVMIIKIIMIKMIIMIITKIKQIKIKIIFQIKKLLLNQNYKFAYLLPLILQNLGVEMKNNPEPIASYALSMIILSLIVLFCFINIFGYILSLYLISNYQTKIEDKYPKLIKYLNYFKNSSKILIIFEAIIGFTFLITIILLNTFLFTIITYGIIK